MAREFGLGITPWSPLKSGVLSGKYTRESSGRHTADRGALVDHFLNEQTFAIIDELETIAKAHETNVASVALAWVHAQPVVSSVIIGARRLSQLDDNVRAVDVTLGTGEGEVVGAPAVGVAWTRTIGSARFPEHAEMPAARAASTMTTLR